MELAGKVLEVGIPVSYPRRDGNGNFTLTQVKIGDSSSQMYFEFFGDEESLKRKGIIVGAFGTVYFNMEGRIGQSGRGFNMVKDVKWTRAAVVAEAGVPDGMTPDPEPMMGVAPDGGAF